MARTGWEEPMPTIEGKHAGVWIDGYVKKAGKLEGVTKARTGLGEKDSKGERGVRESVEDSVI